ncbi:hypothetical protein CRYUN_Cryun09bG0221300 [Craigia yunnanensis]
MEPWFIILISICILVVIKSIINLLFTTRKPSNRLPPGPSTFPIIGNFLWLRKSSFELEHSVRSIHAKFGPIVTLWIGFRPAIFIADRSLAHQALIQNGAVFANRSKPLVDDKISRSTLPSEILHHSRIKSYSHARNWVLKILLDCFKSQYKSGDPVYVLKHFQHAMFCFLVLMCFGDKLETKQIKRIEEVHRSLPLTIGRFNILNFLPSVTKIIFHKRWQELLQLPEENRKLKEEEMASLCSEFLNVGTDTTSTALQWIMANLAKYKNIQDKLYGEIKGVVGEGAEMVKEYDLLKMSYLKAVILESLRRHPPVHLVGRHAVTEDVVLNGFLVPKNGILNFMVAEMGWDSTVWEDPMPFKPERFLSNNEKGGEAFDITGSREIKMMPFGVGRRICPGHASLGVFCGKFGLAVRVDYCQWR